MEQVLERLVSEQRETADLVGLGAILIQDGKVIGPSVSGERKKGSQVCLADKDQWHIGSITKSFTATMIARLVEKGELSWNTTIREAFSEVDGLNAGWNSVTLEDLLTHTSGVVSNFPLSVNFKNPAEGLARVIARETAVTNILKKEPKNTPGSTFLYSNVGYTIAGAIAEKKTGMPWEKLINQEVFTPLQIQSGGFGPPQDSEKELSQPRGHKSIFGFTVASQGDNTPIIGPAGTIHLSLKDLALFANEHLQGERGQGSLLTTETFQRLHNPSLDNYAYGWVVGSPQDLTVGPVIWHNGSNTMWYTLLAILPSTNTVVAVTSNDGNVKVAEQCAWEIIRQLVESLAITHN
jgi:CubicO group peptidase (beta-lactamase class C family)